jgi:hypothetical protein
MQEHLIEIAGENQHYVVISPYYWGAGETLLEAVVNAEAEPLWQFTDNLDRLKHVLGKPLQTVATIKEAMEEANRNFVHDIELTDTDDGRFILSVTDKTRWKFDHFNEVTDKPAYQWIGEGDQPGELESIVLYGRIDQKTGAIQITKKGFAAPIR